MKKRFMFTLTKENVELFQSLVKQGGLHPNTLSNAIDGYIREMNVVIQKCMSQGTFTVADMFVMIGEQLELHEEEPNAEKRKEKGKKGKTDR